MPKSNLVEMMRAHATSHVAKTTKSTVPLEVPSLPELEPMLGPEGLESWDVDWRNIAAMVAHGLTLFEHFNAVLAEHQKERRKAEPEIATDPRERAQQIVAVLQRHQERYEPILAALTTWQQHLEGLRRFYLTFVPAIAMQGLRVALSEALQRLHRPLNDLSAIPALPPIPSADDERALEAALNLARQVKATLTEHSPALFAQALFGVRDRIAKVAEIVRQEDMRLSTEPANHGLTTTPNVFPVLDMGAAIPMGVVEPLDTQAYGQHAWYLP
jgi:hypothetical protein